MEQRKRNKRSKPTACPCGGKGAIYKNGWACEKCVERDEINGRKIERRNHRTTLPSAKYYDPYKCGVEGFQ